MTQQYINAILTFLERTSLTGREAETMVACKQWLRALANESAQEQKQKPEQEDLQRK